MSTPKTMKVDLHMRSGAVLKDIPFICPEQTLWHLADRLEKNKRFVHVSGAIINLENVEQITETKG